MGEPLAFESYLKEIWRRRFRIVGVTFLIAAATAVVSLLLPKTYEAVAQLIVLPAQYKPELASRTPEVQTCQMLLHSPDVLKKLRQMLVQGREVIENLTAGEKLTPEHIEGIMGLTSATIEVDTGCEPEVAQFIADLDPAGLKALAAFPLKKLEEMSLEDLSESLRAEVTEEKKTAIDIIYSPIILIRARARTGQQAALLANTWAKVFLDVYGEMVRNNTMTSYRFIAAEVERFQKDREKIQQELRDLRRRYNLDFLTGWMKTATEKYGDLRSELSAQQLELDYETSRLLSLARTLNAIEDNGVWIGESTGTVAADKPGVEGPDREMRLKVIAAARRLRAASDALGTFLAQNDLDTLRKQRQRAQLDLLDFESQLNKDIVEIEKTSKTLAMLRARIAETSSTLSVRRPSSGSKGIADIVNPAWEELEMQRIRLEVQLAESLARKEKLEKYVKTLAEKIRAEDARLNRLELQDTLLRRELELAQQEYDGYQQAYAELKRDIYDTAQRIGPLVARVGQLRAAAAEMESQITDAQTSITAGQTALAMLETKDNTLERYVSLTLAKLQEARLAVAQQELDVKIASEAIAPTKKIWPQRTLMVLVMTIVGLFLSVGWVCLRHYLVGAGIWSGR